MGLEGGLVLVEFVLREDFLGMEAFLGVEFEAEGGVGMEGFVGVEGSRWRVVVQGLGTWKGLGSVGAEGSFWRVVVKGLGTVTGGLVLFRARLERRESRESLSFSSSDSLPMMV